MASETYVIGPSSLPAEVLNDRSTIGDSLSEIERRFGDHDQLVIDCSRSPLDLGRPQETASVDLDVGALPGTVRVVLVVSSAMAISGGPGSLEGRVLDHPQGAVLHLGRVFTAGDPLLVRWRDALKEGVPVAPLPVTCAPLDPGVAAAGIAALLKHRSARGRFTLRAPDQISYQEIAQLMAGRLGLPVDRVVPTQLWPSDFDLTAWPVANQSQTSHVFAEWDVMTRPARAVVDDALGTVVT